MLIYSLLSIYKYQNLSHCKNQQMNCTQAETISIVDYLSHKGIYPTEKRYKGGCEIRYYSPIRDSDKTPSFDVNIEKNVWYDLGAGIGGGLVRGVQEMYGFNVSQALDDIENTGLYKQGQTYSPSEPEKILYLEERSSAHRKESNNTKQETTTIKTVKPLKNSALVQYLESRYINIDIARQDLVEIYYTRSTSPNKTLFTIGMLNNSGEGYEINNPVGVRSSSAKKSFKSFLGKTKDITSININSGKNLVVFEGWPDFEAFKSHYQFFNFEHSAIILGSTALVKRAIEEVKRHTYEHIFLYLDNDEAGRQATRQLIDALQEHFSITDKSSMYHDHTDFNDWVIAKNKK